MKPQLSFICPVDRDDFIGEGALKHCPHCNLDIPDMSALTRSEAKRVFDALDCAHELSQDLHFCSSNSVDVDGDSVFYDPSSDPDNVFNLFDVSSMVDTTPKLLLAIAAISTLGLTAQIHVFEHILTPAWEGHPVLVLDEDGPRLEPERADSFASAVDASEDAWLTINLAQWRKDAAAALERPFPFTKPVETKFDGVRYHEFDGPIEF